MFGVLIVGAWIGIGLINLCGKNEISKLSYLAVWSVAIAGLIYRFVW